MPAGGPSSSSPPHCSGCSSLRTSYAPRPVRAPRNRGDLAEDVGRSAGRMVGKGLKAYRDGRGREENQRADEPVKTRREENQRADEPVKTRREENQRADEPVKTRREENQRADEPVKTRREENQQADEPARPPELPGASGPTAP